MTTAILLLTWGIWVLALAGWGMLLAPFVTRGDDLRGRLHAAPWLGLACALVLTAGAQLFVSMGGPQGQALMAVIIVGGLICLAVALRPLRRIPLARVRSALSIRRLPAWIVVGLFGLGMVLVARFAAAEPRDFDAGGYRIGAIRYAEAFPAIPGLANLHFRFGFDSTLWPFAAQLGNGPWTGQGFRLVTGLFLLVLFTDLALRVALPRRDGTRPGDWFIVIAGAATGAIILTDSGRWVPSPAQDTCVLVMALAATAFLVDFVHSRAVNARAGAMALILATAAGTIRPLGWLLAFMTAIVVVGMLLWRARGDVSWRAATRPLIVPLAYGLVAFVVMAARDLILSGWLLYPLPLVPFPVEWRTGDPTDASRWITSWGRAPQQDADTVMSSNDWLSPWIGTFLASREFFLMRLMALAAVLPLLWPSGRRAWREASRVVLIATAPSVVLTVAWFITAPDVRFGWAGLIGLFGVPLSLVVQQGAYPYWVARVGGVLILAGLLTTQFLNGRSTPQGAPARPFELNVGFATVTLALAPPPSTPTVPGALADGTPIVFPATGENCWDVFPLCLLPGAGSDVERIGNDIEDGFRLILTSATQ